MKTAQFFISICFAGIIIGLSFLTWQRSKVWKNSLTLWNDVITKYPQDYIPIAYYNRGIVYIGEKEDKKALADLDKALMLYYKVLKIHKNYSQVYDTLLLNGHGYSDIYNFLGVEFANVGRNQEAIILFKQVITTNPADVDGYINLAVTYGRLKRYKEAILNGEKAIKLAPDSPGAHYNLSIAYYFDKQYGLALKHFEIAAQLGFTPNPEFLNNIEQQKRRRTTKNETKK